MAIEISNKQLHMKHYTFSTIALLALGALSCSSSADSVNPLGSARQGSGTTTTPPTTTTTTTTPPSTLPVLAPNATPINDLGPVMPTGTWTIKSYYRSFSDNTSDYNGYKFVFTANVVTVTDNRGNVYSGSWYATIGGQIPYYGGAPSITALTMSFGKSAPKQLSRLSATWNVNLATATTDVVLDNFEPLAGERIEFAQ